MILIIVFIDLRDKKKAEAFFILIHNTIIRRKELVDMFFNSSNCLVVKFSESQKTHIVLCMDIDNFRLFDFFKDEISYSPGSIADFAGSQGNYSVFNIHSIIHFVEIHNWNLIQPGKFINFRSTGEFSTIGVHQLCFSEGIHMPQQVFFTLVTHYTTQSFWKLVFKFNIHRNLPLPTRILFGIRHTSYYL